MVNEPQGSPAWFPVNDNPRDKATYDFAITVPAGITALANGVLVSSASSGGRTTWRWRETDPMASYLATATNGRFDLDTTQTGPNGLPIYNAVDSGLNPKRKATAKGLLSEAPEIVRSSASSTARTRSTRPAGSSTRRRTSATRSRRRPSPSTPTCRTSSRSSTSSRTCGSATRSR